MDNRYKVIIANRNIYKEIELSPNMTQLKVGTSAECDVRMRKDAFFEPIELLFTKNRGQWSVVCSDNIYFSEGDVRKLISKALNHGDELTAKYQNAGGDIFNLSFMLDFDYIEKAYDVFVDIAAIQKLTIGGADNCNIIVKSPFVGSDSFTIEHSGDRFVLKHEKTQYGVYLNAKKIEKDTALQENDFISLADFSFCLRKGKLYTTLSDRISFQSLNAVEVHNSKSEHEYPRFNRNTRIKSILPDEKIIVLDPPAVPQKPSGSIIMKLLPALAMLAITVVFRGLMNSSGSSYVWISVFTMSVGIITSVVSIIGERKKYKKDTANRIVQYDNYMAKKEEQIQKCRSEELDLLNEKFCSLEDEITMVDDFSADLFNRSPEDDDFLEIRLGTGRNRAVREIDYKKQEKLECTDELANKPGEIAEKYKYIDNAPVTVSLREKNAIGVVGERCYLYDMLKNITFDLAIRQYYTDVSLFYIFEESHGEQFGWLRFLPHLQNTQLGGRNIVCDTDSRNSLFEYLYKELSRREAEAATPHSQIVVFVYDDFGLKRHPISRFVERSASLGVNFIFFEEYNDFLPNSCAEVIKLYDHESGEVVSAQDYTKRKKFIYTTLSDKTASKIVSKLAPVYCDEVSLEGSLTKNITLYELLNIMSADDIDLAENWAKSTVYKSMAAPLGVKSKNEIVYLDLNEKHHGPHGLVAGTTGSGKSEILQSYILSMATLFHPYEVGFVIIDFKGGGMVNQFKNLPHLIGAITNIDGREINRSLLSIKAELRKRQELLAEYGVNHIDAYIKLYKKGETKIPLPHLILIVDEFAELKMDQPEFMKELISAARIGRSLGVHLILATQKPSGVVDAQIWSNSKFKLCLKVQNKEDSNEVLKTPLAAEIKEPGRAYLQVGNNEIFDLFQSAYSGASSSADDTKSQKTFTLYQLNLSGKHTPIYTKKVEKSNDDKETQLTAIVNYVAAYCSKEGIEHLPGICLPPLTDVITYTKATDTHDAIHTILPIGVYDDPDNQYQGEVTIDLLDGNTVIIGASQYGKTNILQTMIRGISTCYTPQDVNIYILDFGSMALRAFDSLNHIGGVVVASEDEKLKNFVRMIRVEMKKRKEVFSKIGITSFSSYKEAGHTDIPHIVIMIDNFIALKELYPEYEDDILNVCREGIAVGISVVMTSIQTNGISYKYMSNFSNRICLYCNQSDEYGNLFDKCRMEPKNIPGRGLVAINRVVYEYQTYLAFEGAKEIERVERIKTYIQSINAKCAGTAARKIPEVPHTLDAAYVRSTIEDAGLSDMQVPIGIDYDTVEYVTIDLSKALTIGVTGREGYGKTNFTKLLISHLQSKIFDSESKVYIIDDYEKQLEPLASFGVVERYSIDISDFENVLTEVEEELQTRLKRVRAEGVEVLSEMPLIFIVVQNNDIYTPDGIGKAAVESYKRILKTYRNMKVCFLFSNIANVGIAYGATEMLKLVKEYSYLFVMDDLANLKLLDINAATLRQYKKLIELGDAYMITEKGVSKQKIIHVKEE